MPNPVRRIQEWESLFNKYISKISSTEVDLCSGRLREQREEDEKICFPKGIQDEINAHWLDDKNCVLRYLERMGRHNILDEVTNLSTDYNADETKSTSSEISLTSDDDIDDDNYDTLESDSEFEDIQDVKVNEKEFYAALHETSMSRARNIQKGRMPSEGVTDLPATDHSSNKNVNEKIASLSSFQRAPLKKPKIKNSKIEKTPGGDLKFQRHLIEKTQSTDIKKVAENGMTPHTRILKKGMNRLIIGSLSKMQINPYRPKVGTSDDEVLFEETNTESAGTRTTPEMNPIEKSSKKNFPSLSGAGETRKKNRTLDSALDLPETSRSVYHNDNRKVVSPSRTLRNFSKKPSLDTLPPEIRNAEEMVPRRGSFLGNKSTTGIEKVAGNTFSPNEELFGNCESFETGTPPLRHSQRGGLKQGNITPNSHFQKQRQSEIFDSRKTSVMSPSDRKRKISSPGEEHQPTSKIPTTPFSVKLMRVSGRDIKISDPRLRTPTESPQASNISTQFQRMSMVSPKLSLSLVNEAQEGCKARSEAPTKPSQASLGIIATGFGELSLSSPIPSQTSGRTIVLDSTVLGRRESIEVRAYKSLMKGRSLFDV